jgi:hypothetical protein
MPEKEMHRLLNEFGFTVANLKYRLDAESDSFEYEMTIRTYSADNAGKLALALNRVDAIKEYRILPAGD